MPTNLKVIVGSKSPHKIQAVTIALAQCNLSYMEVHGCSASSGIAEQPVGFEEILAGATNRARAARTADPGAFLAVGIENGLLRASGVTLDLAVVVLLDQDGNMLVSSSPGVLFPEEATRVAESRGFKTTTVAKVLSETLGCDPTDAGPALSGNRIHRVPLLTEAVYVALQMRPGK